MAHTHEFDCRVCGAHLDSKNDLDRHTQDRHPQKSSSPGGQYDQSRKSEPPRDVSGTQ